MSDKKHIDRIFQEKLKDLEITPDNSVWKSIHTDLKKKKKDRIIIPLWWKLSGVAAGILLLIAIGSFYLTEKETSSTETLVESPRDESDSILTNNSIETDSNEEVVKSSSKGDNKSESQIVIVSDNLEEKLESKQNLVQKRPFTSIKKHVANSNVDLQNESETINQPHLNNKEDVIANTINDSEKVIAETNVTEKPEDEINTKSEINDIQNAIIQDVVNNEKKDQENTNKESIKRWSINPNIAPVYFSSFGDGSTIHSQFIDNSKSGKINMSYGVNASYALNHKLSVRTGISKVNMGYSTNNVAVLGKTPVGLLNESLYKNIEFSNSGSRVMFLNVSQSVSEDSSTALPNRIKGEIDQEFGFIEIPVELEYKLLDNKIGMSVIGGVSTLFLNNNELYSVLDGEKTLLGEARNINKTSFSANFGVGMHYNISKKINVNIEPTFKYQLNTFDNTSGDVKPYFIGIYSGIKYKF